MCERSKRVRAIESVCERMFARGGESLCWRERVSEWERECVFMSGRESVCVSGRERVCEREREHVCERERKRESV